MFNRINRIMYAIAFLGSVGLLWFEPERWIVRGCCCLIFLAAFQWASHKPDYQYMLWSNQSDAERIEYQNLLVDLLVTVATAITLLV